MNKAANDFSDIDVLMNRTKQKAAKTIPPISPQDWETIEKLVRTVARHGTKIAEALLDNSLCILQHLGLEGLEKISQLGITVSLNCGKTALGIFQQCPKLLDRLLTYGNKDFVLALYHTIGQIARNNWQVAVFLLDNSPELIERIGYDGFKTVALYGDKIARENCLSALEMLEKCKGCIDEILNYGKTPLIMDVFDCFCRTADHCWQTSLHLFERSPELIGSLGYDGFYRIAEKACELSEFNKDRAISFIRGESMESAEFMDGITENLKLRSVKPVLTHYLNALLNYRVEIAPADDHSTDGSRIFLPENICEFTNKKENFILYKVFATHEEAHLEYGSFDFCLSEVLDLVDDIKAKYGQS